MQGIFFKVSVLAVINVETIETAASFLALGVWGN